MPTTTQQSAFTPLDSPGRWVMLGAFLGIVAVFWYLYNLIGVFGLAAGRLRGDSALNRQIGGFASRLSRILLIVIALLVVAQSVFNWNVTAWVAGLGIAGLAVSLAAQDLLKNFFGSLAILMDRSFRIDDHIIACGYDGTVTDVGLRSTRLRTIAGHEVTIPNANLMNNLIENLSRCPAVRRVVTLPIAGKTPAEKLCQALAALTSIFDEEAIRRPVRPFVDGAERPPEVRFEDFRPGGFKLTIAYWYAPATDPAYAAHAERVNLQIVAALEQVGVELIQPAR